MTQFALPIRAWDSSREIIISILVASLLLNVLALVFPLTLLQVYDRIIPNEAIATLVWLVIAVFTSLVLIAILKVLRSYVGAWADSKFEHIIGCEAFNSIMQCSIMEYEKEGTGKHLKRLGALNTLRDFYAGQAVIALVDVPFVAVFLLLVGYIAGWLVIVPLIMVLIVLGFALMSSLKMKNLLSSRQDHDNRRLNFIVETLSKIHTIKSNTMEAQMLRRFERLQKSSSLYDYKVTQRGSYMMSETMSLSQMTVALVVALGAVMVFNGYLTVGGLAACTLLSGRCLQPINSLITVWNRLQAVKLAREEFDKVLEMKPETNKDLEKIVSVDGDIRFENVCYGDEIETTQYVKDVSFSIRANEVVSISGEGAAGKSIIMWLLMNMVKPSSGAVYIDDKDVTTLDPYTLRDQIGCMTQDAVIFSGTILENITMFDENLNDTAVLAAKAIGLAGIVEHLPDGYDTKVGQHAVDSLPRGIAQRIIITRALVKNPKIILFDEANIALDMEGDKQLREMFDELKGKHTIIIISHRPSFLSLGERSFVFESGTIRQIDNG